MGFWAGFAAACAGGTLLVVGLFSWSRRLSDPEQGLAPDGWPLVLIASGAVLLFVGGWLAERSWRR